MGTKRILFIFTFILLLVSAFLAFLFSCVVTMSDGQGALIFIFTLPLITLLLGGALLLARSIDKNKKLGFSFQLLPKVSLFFLLLFIVLSFIPILNFAPQTFLKYVGISFESITGKTPYLYFRERNSFPSHLSKSLSSPAIKEIDFSSLGVSFAWDKLCIFGPYTDNAKARRVINLDWNIEDRSEIHYSDSINALVFLFEGKVNQVVDLKRGIADFSKLDFCVDRNQTLFSMSLDGNGRKLLSHKKY